jgi:hypothetical protein
MKKDTESGKNFVDALAGEYAFVVLTKRGRVQILVQPTRKQLRKRGKRGWQLFDTVAQDADASTALLKRISAALESVQTDGETTEDTTRDTKPPKKAANK